MRADINPLLCRLLWRTLVRLVVWPADWDWVCGL